jgi:DNA modification methylase
MSELVCEIMIENHTNEGDVVYDPFMGSGTTGVACIKTGRKYLGSEIDEKVKNIAESRLT